MIPVNRFFFHQKRAPPQVRPKKELSHDILTLCVLMNAVHKIPRNQPKKKIAHKLSFDRKLMRLGNTPDWIWRCKSIIKFSASTSPRCYSVCGTYPICPLILSPLHKCFSLFHFYNNTRMLFCQYHFLKFYDLFHKKET